MGMALVDIQKPCPQFLLGFGLINFYIPGIIGASVVSGWLFLLLIIPFLLSTIRITSVNILGTLFLIYATLSLIWTKNINIAFFIYLQIIILCAVFCLASSLNSIKWIIVGLSIGLLPSDLLAFIKYFWNYDFVFALQGNVAGLFVNKNIFCEVSALLFVILVVYKLYWYIPFTLPGIIFVQSRGALLGLFVGMSIWLFKVNRTSFYIFCIVAVTLAGLNIEKFSTVSVIERFDLWGDTINGLTFKGNGVGSFEILYPYYATYIDTSLSRPRFAHNDLLQLIFEFGIGSIFVLIAIYKLIKKNNVENIILYSLGTMAMFSYPLHIPVTAFIGFLVAGYINRDLPVICNTRIDWGPHIFKRNATG